MDAFIGAVLAALKEHGARAVRVFPPETNVLLAFSDRLANDVVSCYVSFLGLFTSCLTHMLDFRPGGRIYITVAEPGPRNLK